MINENIKNTGISFFAIFDGHGGEYAAVFAKDYLVENLYKKIVQTNDIVTGKVPPPSPYLRRMSKCPNEIIPEADELNTQQKDTIQADEKLAAATAQRRSSFKKSLSTADDCNGPKSNCNRDQDIFINKLGGVVRTKESFLKTNNNNVKPQQYEARCYIDKDNKINFGKMITDEMLAADFKLIEIAKKDVSKYFMTT